MHKKYFLYFFGIVVSLAFLFSPFNNLVHADNVIFEIDPNITNASIPWGSSVSGVGKIVETWVSPSDQTVCSVKHKITSANGATDSIVLKVYHDILASPIGRAEPEIGPQIGEVSIPASALPLADGVYASFNFTDCLEFVADGRYSFVWSRSNSSAPGNYMSLISLSQSPWDYFPVTSAWLWELQWGGYWREEQSWDLSFRLESGISEPERTPVLIISGIAGTELYNGDDLIWADLVEMLGSFDVGDDADQFLTQNLALDIDGNSIADIQIGNMIEKLPDAPLPVALNVDIFKSLREELESIGYVLDQDLFYFPYDWRLDVDITKHLLNQEIERIKLDTGFGKVNIVAHSMGGILAKNYLDQYGINSIDKLIFVGTPHLGAPKAGKVLLAGDDFDIPFLEKKRIKEIAQNSPAVYELLPQQKYFDKSLGYIKTGGRLLNHDDTNTFLVSQDLNTGLLDRSENFFEKNLPDLDLSGIDAYNIVGCGVNTQAAYEFNSNGSMMKKIGYTSGDKTVPLVSARYVNIPDANKFYVKKGVHAELPSNEVVIGPIINILSSVFVSNNENFSSIPFFCDFRGKQLIWRSPVEVHIYDSQGNHTGPIDNNGIEYGIPGVDYEIIDGEKFVFLPTDEGQVYDVIAKGEAVGTFDLLIGDNNNGDVINTTVFNDVEITSASIVSFEISDSSKDDLVNFDYTGAGTNITLLADAVLNQEQAEDITAPTTDAIVSGTAGDIGWYRSDVEVTLDVIDDNSGILETRYSLDGGLTFEQYVNLVSITQEGHHTVEFYSIDRAGNNEAVQTLEINIDKTAPEFVIQFDIDNKDFQITSADTIACGADSCTASDQAGNTTIVTFTQSKLPNTHMLSLKFVKYNSEELEYFDDNLLIVRPITRMNTLTSLNQTLWIKHQELVSIRYSVSTNTSTIFKLLDGNFIKETVSGLKLLQINTDRGKIKSI